MDVTITGYMIGLENEKKDKIISDVINNIKKYNGILNLLWHNNSYVDYSTDKNVNLLDSILKQAVK